MAADILKDIDLSSQSQPETIANETWSSLASDSRDLNSLQSDLVSDPKCVDAPRDDDPHPANLNGDLCSNNRNGSTNGINSTLVESEQMESSVVGSGQLEADAEPCHNLTTQISDELVLERCREQSAVSDKDLSGCEERSTLVCEAVNGDVNTAENGKSIEVHNTENSRQIDLVNGVVVSPASVTVPPADATPDCPAKCTHSGGGVNLAGVKKQLSTIQVGVCEASLPPDESPVRRQSKRQPKRQHKRHQNQQPCSPSDSVSGSADSQPTVYVCLQCGYQSCEVHALSHVKVPRSDCHSLALCMTTGVVRCFTCGRDTPIPTCRKLDETVRLIQKRYTLLKAPPGGSKVNAVNSTTVVDAVTESAKEKPKFIVCPPKGLINTGNTCYMNAVLQCLACCCSLLNHLPLCNSTDYTLQLNDHLQQPWRLQLTEPCGPLSATLTSLLLQMSNSNNHSAKSPPPASSKINKKATGVAPGASLHPGTLLHQIAEKAPQFSGHDQQDSQELLRTLLDLLRQEEIKRRHAAILRAFGLSTRVRPDSVEADVRKQLKLLGRQAAHSAVDQIFGGLLIGIVECQSCRDIWHHCEPFFDLSLPVVEDKPGRPKKMSSVSDCNGDLDESLEPTTQRRDGSNKMRQKKVKKGKRKSRDKNLPNGDAMVKSAEADILDSDPSESRDGDVDDSDNCLPAMASLFCDSESSHSATTPSGGNSANYEDETVCGVSDDATVSIDSHLTEALSHLCLADESPSKQQQQQIGGCEGALAGGQIQRAPLEEQEELVGGDLACDSAGVNKTSINASSVAAVSLKQRVVCVDLSTGSVDGGDEKQPDVVAPDGLITENGSEAVSNVTETVSNTNHTDDILSNTTETVSNISNIVETVSETADPVVSDPSSNETDANGSSTPIVDQSWLRRARRSLSLYTPSTPTDGCSVRAALAQFTASELLAGCNRLVCDSCTRQRQRDHNDKPAGYGEEGDEEDSCSGSPVYSSVSRQLLIFSAPPVLTLHLKRFQVAGGALRKVNHHVHFDTELDLAPFCSSEVRQTRLHYSLFAVVNHSGRLSGGHYTAYVRVRSKYPAARSSLSSLSSYIPLLNNKLHQLPERDRCELQHQEQLVEEQKEDIGTGWYHVSDTVVRAVSLSQVLRSQAYLLFYERDS